MHQGELLDEGLAVAPGGLLHVRGHHGQVAAEFAGGEFLAILEGGHDGVGLRVG